MRRARSPRASFAALLVFFVALGAPAFARADDLDAALDELKVGAGYFKKGEFLTALAHYEKARTLAPAAPGPYRELGKAYTKAGRLPEAFAAYDRYLTLKPDAKDGADVRKSMGEIHGTLEREWGRVDFASAPAGAELHLDGEAVAAGVTPLKDFWIRPGDHRVGFALAGHAPAEQHLMVIAGGRAELSVTLVPAASPATGTGLSGTTGGVGATGVGPAAGLSSPATGSPAGGGAGSAAKRGSSPWVWVGVGGGALVVAGGASVLALFLLGVFETGAPPAELPPIMAD